MSGNAEKLEEEEIVDVVKSGATPDADEIEDELLDADALDKSEGDDVEEEADVDVVKAQAEG